MLLPTVLIRKSDAKGTTIDIYLPASIGDADCVEDFPSRSAVETVLIVDDDPDSLAAAAELFRNIGYEIVMAGDAATAGDCGYGSHQGKHAEQNCISRRQQNG